MSSTYNTLDGTLSELQQAYAALTQLAVNHRIRFDVADYGGFRSAQITDRILSYRLNDYRADVAAGRVSPDTTLSQYRPIAPYGESWHDYGAAFDVEITDHPAGMSNIQALQLLGGLAPLVGLRWGGAFHSPDTPHFELAIPLADARQRYADEVGGAAADATGTALSFDATSGDDVYDDAADVGMGGDLAAAYTEAPGPVVLFAGLAALATVAWALWRRFGA